MKSTIKILLFCILPLACTQTGDKWQKVRYEKSTTEKYSVTNCNKNGQMIEKAYVYFDSDTLYIDFPPQLPAYWDAVKIKIHNEKFCSEACGIPFAPIKIAFTPVEQRLQLNSRDIAPGDTLCGNFTLVFQYTATPEMDNDYDKPEQGAYTLQGSICEVVRDKNYDPFANSNFMDFDLPAALRELGEPLLREQFDLSAPLSEFRAPLLELLSPDENISIEELTWDASDTRCCSDAGKERLTIWYRQSKTQWKPVSFRRWIEQDE